MTRLKQHLNRLRAVQERKDLRQSRPSTLLDRRLEEIRRRSEMKKREDQIGS